MSSTLDRLRREIEAPAARPNELKRRGIDLESLRCADFGHRWIQTELERSRDGKLRGLPVRIAVCEVCDRQRTDVLTWSGRIVARYYSAGEDYLENARRLSDDQWERRSEYRRLLLASLPGPRSIPDAKAS